MGICQSFQCCFIPDYNFSSPRFALDSVTVYPQGGLAQSPLKTKHTPNTHAAGSLTVHALFRSHLLHQMVCIVTLNGQPICKMALSLQVNTQHANEHNSQPTDTLHYSEGASITAVSSPEELFVALAREDAHIEIQSHLDLAPPGECVKSSCVPFAVDDEDLAHEDRAHRVYDSALSSIPATVQSIRVRS